MSRLCECPVKIAKNSMSEKWSVSAGAKLTSVRVRTTDTYRMAPQRVVYDRGNRFITLRCKCTYVSAKGASTFAPLYLTCHPIKRGQMPVDFNQPAFGPSLTTEVNMIRTFTDNISETRRERKSF